MLKNVGENIKTIFALIFFYTLDIRNIIFNPKFNQHFLPSLVITFFEPYKEIKFSVRVSNLKNTFDLIEHNYFTNIFYSQLY